MWACHRPNGRRSKIFRNAREISRHNCGASPTALITPEVYGQLLLTRSLGALFAGIGLRRARAAAAAPPCARPFRIFRAAR